MVKKFTDEELSRILSHSHELKQGGSHRDFLCTEVGCINQVAYNDGNKYTSMHLNRDVAHAFDTVSRWKIGTPDRILRLIEKVGAA